MRQALGLWILLGLWSCGSGGGGGGRLQIQSCSLGCTSSGTGIQLSCPITEVFVNQVIRVAFSAPVDLSSVNTNTFRVKQVGVGKTPSGRYELDPSDPRVVVYRPLVTFDNSGAPSFGFEDDVAYNITIPGTLTDPNETAYVRSTSGGANTTRMFCTVVASRGIFDAKPGQPAARTEVDVVSGAAVLPDQDPETDFDPLLPVVSRDTAITIQFDDVMNPATLVNPVTNDSSTITVRIDTDGDISDSSDQVDVPGAFDIAIDQVRFLTTVTFTPTGELPSSGSDPLEKRRVVIDLPGSIEDLGGNGIQDPRRIVFTSEQILFQATTLSESFDLIVRQDQPRSGTGWTASGALAPATAGGSGRLGDLIVPAGITVTLDTDSEDFSGISDRTVFDPGLVVDASTPGVVDPITDAVFEFARLRVDGGGTLRLAGSQAPRLYVRGECTVQGVLDVSGRSGVAHDSTLECGGEGGEPGPSGGRGGDGGTRPDGADFVAEGGEANIDKPSPDLYEDVDGKPGIGVLAPTTIDPMPTLVGGADGGLAWPQPDPSFPAGHFPADITDTDGMQFEQRFSCQSRIPGGAGGGGANAFDGKEGVAKLVAVSSIDPATPPPDTAGGDNTGLVFDPLIDPEAGFLRGGGGGGGGGAHLQETSVNGLILNDCTLPATGATLVIQAYRHHSSAGGGGGGGAVQVQAGRRLQVDGVVDASGGDGGDTLVGRRAQAGGGGAGGAVLLQAPTVLIQNVANRIDVSGGRGGVGVNGSNGGLASPGFVRLESIDVPLVFAAEAGKVSPTDAMVQADFAGTIMDLLSVGTWVPPTQGGPLPTLGADARSGIQSCWFRPPGNFFELVFAEDGDDLSIDGLGWDMTVRLSGIGAQSYRGDNDMFPGMTLEEAFGNDLGSAPVIVRFQGARLLGSGLSDPCNVTLAGLDSQIFPGSLTPWVKHPSEMNSPDNPVLRPNIVRFTVIWDASQPFYDDIEGIEEIVFPVQPD